MNSFFRGFLALTLLIGASAAHALATPTNFKSSPATSYDGTYTLSWNAVSTDVYGNPPANPVTSYQIVGTNSAGGKNTRNRSGTSISSGSFSSSFRVVGTHSFTVVACASGDCSVAATTSVTVKNRAIPSNVQVTVSETTSTDGSYTISGSATSGTTTSIYENGVLLRASAGSSVSYNRGGRKFGLHNYYVKSCNFKVDGSEQCVRTLPKIVRVVGAGMTAPSSSDNGSYSVAWDAASVSPKHVLFEQIEDSDWRVLGNNLASHTVTNRDSGTYHYRLAEIALQSLGAIISPIHLVKSTPVSVQVLPDVPQGLAATAGNEAGASALNWIAIDDANFALYTLHEKREGEAGFSWEANKWVTDSSHPTSHALVGLPAGTHEYRIRSRNEVGATPLNSAWSSSLVVLVPEAAVVTAPATNDDGNFPLTWTTPPGAIADYRLERRVDGGNWSLIASPVTPSFDVSGIVVSGDYQYRVLACSSQACGVYSNAPVVDVDIPIPATPGSLTLPASDDDGSFGVSWVPAIGIDVQYDIQIMGASGEWESVYYGYSEDYAASVYQIGTHSVRVRACNTSGCSGFNTAASVNVTYVAPNFRGVAVNPADDPDGTVYRGQLKGNFSVGKDGSANYSIPIEVPPGINGMQPKLSLSYNSNRGNGLLGQGWAIGGLSKIHRCRASIVRDGYVDGINYDDDYKFCIDGQRLVEVANNEYRTESESYAKIIASGSYGGGPAYWTVYKRDGSVLTYGNGGNSAQTEQSRVEIYAWNLNKMADLAGNYMLYTYERDTAAGIFRPESIEYTKNDAAADTQHKVQFSYAARPDVMKKYVAGSLNSTDKRLQMITMTSGGDMVSVYVLTYQNFGNTYFGKVFEDPVETSRVANVLRCYPGSYNCAAPVEFDWTSAESSTFGVESVELYMGAPGSVGLFTGFHGLLNGRTVGDFDGDGELEFCRLGEDGTTTEVADVKDASQASAWFVNVGGDNNCPFSSMVKDLNGDGLDDIVTGTLFDASGVDQSIRVLISKGSFFTEEDWGLELNEVSGSGMGPVAFMDMDGDSLPDLIRYNLDGEAVEVRVRLNTGAGFAAPTVWHSSTQLTDIIEHNFDGEGANEWYTWIRQNISFGDFNGDGLPDLYVCKQLAFDSPDCQPHVLLNTGSASFASPVEWGPSNYKTEFWPPETVVDLNGDSLADVLLFTAQGINVLLSTGEGFIDAGQWSNEITSYYLAESLIFSRYDVHHFFNGERIVPRISVQRVNDDTCPDLVIVGGEDPDVTTFEGMAVALSKCDGTGFLPFERWWTDELFTASGAYFAPDRKSGGSVRSMDIDGDGMADFPPLYTSYYLKSKLNKGLMLGAYAGDLHSVELDFSTITDTSVHQSGNPQNGYEQAGIYNIEGDSRDGNGSSWSIQRPVPKFVVKDAFVSDGAGGTIQHNYFYRGYQYNPIGWGSLGFSEVRHDEVLSPFVVKREITEYSQEITGAYSLVGRPLKKSIYATDLNGGVLRNLSETDYRWQVRAWTNDIDGGSFNSPHYFPFIHSTVSKHWDLDGTFTHDSIVQNFFDFTTDCDVPAPTSIEISSDTSYDNHGNLLYSLQSECDGYGRTARAIATDGFSDIDTGTFRVFGLVDQRVVTEWVDEDPSVNGTRKTAYTYTGLGQLLTQIIEPDDSLLRKVTTFGYNSYGTVDDITDSWDVAANIGFDFTGRSINTSITESFASNGDHTVVKTNPMLQEERTVFDGRFGGITSFTDVNDLTVSTVYDVYGRVDTITRHDNTVTDVDYFSCSNCEGESLIPAHSYYLKNKSTGESPQFTYFDALDREVMLVRYGLTGGDVLKTTGYNSSGGVSWVNDAFVVGESMASTIYDYDILDRLTKTTHADNSETRIAYSGQVVTTINGLNQVNTQLYNARGQLKSSEDDEGNIVAYDYGPFGNLTKTAVTPNGSGWSVTTTIGYDNLGRKTTLDDPDTGIWTFEYNALDMVSRQTDANNTITEYGYDELGRQTKRVWDAGIGGTATRTAQWIYDSAANGQGLVGTVLGYDTQGRLYQEDYTYTAHSLVESVDTYIDGLKYSTRYYYDAYNRLKGVELPGGYVTEAYSYNEFGYLNFTYNAQSSPDSTDFLHWATDMDGWGNTTTEVFGNFVTVEHAYQPDTGLIHTIEASKSGFVIQDHEYAFDALGNLEWRADHRASVNLTQSFCYDDVNRLTGSSFSACSDGDYTYNGLGNLRTKGSDVTATAYGEGAAGPHALTSATVNGVSLTYVYDANGQMTSRGGETIDYSAFGKPVLMDGNGRRTEIIYGPDESRIQRIDDTNRMTTYVGSQFEKIVDGANTTLNYYVGDYAVYSVVNGAESWSYLHRDHIGSLVATSNQDPSAAADIQWQAFAPWGAALVDSWNGSEKTELDPTERGFTDHEHLIEVGLIHMNGRVYDPLIGRFVSPDPLIQAPTNSQSYNRYSYVMNNPLSFVDPSGYEAKGATDKTRNLEIEEVGVTGKEWLERCREASDCFTGTQLESLRESIAMTLGGLGYVEDSVSLHLVVSKGNELPSIDELGAWDTLKVIFGQKEVSSRYCTGPDCLEPQFMVLPIGGSGAVGLRGALVTKGVGNLNGMALGEAKKLMSRWDKSTYSSVASSIRDHATRHGFGKDIPKYLRKAANFNKRGAKQKNLEGGATRWNRKNGEFLIERNGKIVTYGIN